MIIVDIINEIKKDNVKMKDNLSLVGKYKEEYNDILDMDLPTQGIYVDKGLKIHIKNRHPNCLKYFENIADIIANPTYIGTHPKKENSVEYVKVYDENIMIGVKLDTKNNYLYVATLFDIPKNKIEKRLLTGRLKEY